MWTSCTYVAFSFFLVLDHRHSSEDSIPALIFQFSFKIHTFPQMRSSAYEAVSNPCNYAHSVHNSPSEPKKSLLFSNSVRSGIFTERRPIPSCPVFKHASCQVEFHILIESNLAPPFHSIRSYRLRQQKLRKKWRIGHYGINGFCGIRLRIRWKSCDDNFRGHVDFFSTFAVEDT